MKTRNSKAQLPLWLEKKPPLKMFAFFTKAAAFFFKPDKSSYHE
jgi:hypothetical protein